MKTAIFWFRRDLRLTDNTALNAALKSGLKVLPIFIFDSNILDDLEKDDARVSFIHETLSELNDQLKGYGSGVQCLYGDPLEVWKTIINEHDISDVYINKDYEPYAIQRDKEVHQVLAKQGIELYRFKDQVIFEEGEIVKNDGLPYTVYTPFKNKWLAAFYNNDFSPKTEVDFQNFKDFNVDFPSIENLGFIKSSILVQPFNFEQISDYEKAARFS